MLSITSPVTFYIFVCPKQHCVHTCKPKRGSFYFSFLCLNGTICFTINMKCPLLVNSAVGFEVSQFTQNTNYWHCDLDPAIYYIAQCECNARVAH